MTPASQAPGVPSGRHRRAHCDPNGHSPRKVTLAIGFAQPETSR